MQTNRQDNMCFDANGNLLAETDASGNTTAEYIFFGGKRISMLPAGGNPIYYVEDLLGTSRITTSNSGVVCYDADFYPYGGERPYTNTCPQNYKFEGKERDTETGNDDFGARYYSARLGRFLSTDPLGGSVGNLQSHNPYAYTRNNPLNFTDPSGLWPGCDRGDASCVGEAKDAVFAALACRAWGCGDGPTCIVNGFATPCGMAFSLIQQGLGVVCLTTNCSGYQTQWTTVGDRYMWLLSSSITWDPDEWDAGVIVASGTWVDVGSVTSVNSLILGQASGNSSGNFKPTVAYTFSLVVPLYLGFGPAVTLSYVPSQKLFCGGGGGGVSLGHSVSVGAVIVDANHTKGILGGPSLSGGYNSTPYQGAQGSINTSGSTGGYSFGIPGLSGSVTYSGCHNF